ncbi:MAG: EamA family transporter [Actinomycetota bacterium]
MAVGSPRVWSALGIVYLVWGSTYLAIRFSVQTMPPFASAAARFILAGSILLGVVSVRGGVPVWRVEPRRLRNAAISGILLLTSGNGLVVLGETRVPSGLAALLVAAVPLWLVVVRRIVGDRTPVATVLGVLIGLCGVAVLLLPGSRGGQVDLLYCGIILLAALSWSIGSLVAVRSTVPHNLMMLSAGEMIAGGLLLAFLAAIKGEFAHLRLDQVSAKSWLALGYLVIFGSIVAFSAYVWVLGNAPTSLVATYAYVNPAVAVALGVLIAGEQLRLIEILGGAVILVCVLVVVRAEAQTRTPAPDPVAEGCAAGTR